MDEGGEGGWKVRKGKMRDEVRGKKAREGHYICTGEK
jgi:hypothetical protein